MPLPAIPAIAAILARGAAVVGRVLGPLLGRGAVQAAPTLAAATPAAPSVAGSVAAAGARAGVAPAVSQAMASTPTGAAASTPATINVNLQGAAQQAARAPRWRGAPVSQTPTPSAPQTPSTLQRAFGPLMNLVRPSGQQAAQQATQQAAQQAAQGQQSSFQGAAQRAQNAATRFAQRGAQLYQGVRNDTQERRREDYKEFRTNLNAGMEALKNYDPKALAFWGKAAGIGLKYLTAIVAGPIGVTAFLALLPKKLRDFGDALLEARRPLAEIHGGMAATFARFDAERLGRNMRFASMTSGSTDGLARAVSRLEERILPYAAAGVNALNNILILGERFTSMLQGAIETLHPELKVIIGLLAKDDGGKSSGDLAQFALSMKNGEFFNRRKPPKDKKDKPGYDGPFMG